MDIVRSDLPNYEDLKGAAAALMRLQDTYQLDTTLVAHGELGGLSSPVLSGRKCSCYSGVNQWGPEGRGCSKYESQNVSRGMTRGFEEKKICHAVIAK